MMPREEEGDGEEEGAGGDGSDDSGDKESDIEYGECDGRTGSDSNESEGEGNEPQVQHHKCNVALRTNKLQELVSVTHRVNPQQCDGHRV